MGSLKDKRLSNRRKKVKDGRRKGKFLKADALPSEGEEASQRYREKRKICRYSIREQMDEIPGQRNGQGLRTVSTWARH